MKRTSLPLQWREFISLLGGAAAAWPLTARAQQAGKTVTIGILAIEAWPPIDTFRGALDDLGYVEGGNVRFEHRYAKGRNDRFPELAKDLVGLKVDVILTWGTDAALAAKRATTTIPIVMGSIGDPIGSGIVSSLARPEANITGFSSLAAELEAKRLELLKELVPGLSRVAVFINPTNHYAPLALQSVRRAAEMLNVSLTQYEVSDITTLDRAFEKLPKDRPNAFIVLGDTFLVSQRSRVAQFAMENKLPSAYTLRDHVEAGGLIAYTPDYHDLFRRAASYVDKIMKGGTQEAIRALGLQYRVVNAATAEEFEVAFARLSAEGVKGVVLLIDPSVSRHAKKIAELAQQARLPTAFQRRENVEMGGLMCYGADYVDLYRQAGVYVGRILKGEKPADLPVMQPTKFVFVINRKTARSLGLEVPPSLLAIADEVIE